MFYGALKAVVLQYMIGLWCDKTYGVMTKYDNGDDDRDDNVNEDGNDDDNSAYISGSDGPIFGLIITSLS